MECVVGQKKDYTIVRIIRALYCTEISCSVLNAFTDYLKQVLIICLMIVWLDEASFPVTEKHYGQKEVPVQYFYTEQTEV